MKKIDNQRVPNINISLDKLSKTKKHKTETEIEYSKELQRVKRKLSSLEKKGIDTTGIKIPKTLTAIKKLTNKQIVQKTETKAGKVRGKKIEDTAQSVFMKEYKKQVSKEKARIKRQLKSLENRGYNVSGIEIPEDLETLKELTLDEIYRRVTYTLPSGEIVSGTEGRDYERKQRAKKSAETRRKKKEQYLPRMEDIIIDNVMELLQRLENGSCSWRVGANGKPFPTPPRLYDVAENSRLSLVSLLKSEIEKYGTNAIARRLENSLTYEDLIGRVNIILYGWQSNEDTTIGIVQGVYQELASYIKGGMLSQDELQYFSELDEESESIFDEE